MRREKGFKIYNENKTINEFLSNLYIGYSESNSLIYNYRDELLDKNKTLKNYGFYNNDIIDIPPDYRGYGPFTDNKFFEKVILSDLITEQNNNIFKIYSPSRSIDAEIRENELMSFDIIGSNEGSVFGGKNGRYSLDSNVAKAAVFEGKVEIGKKAIVFLKISRNNNYFEGDTRNGIKTSDFRFITDFCFTFTDEVLSDDYYKIKYKLIKR